MAKRPERAWGGGRAAAVLSVVLLTAVGRAEPPKPTKPIEMYNGVRRINPPKPPAPETKPEPAPRPKPAAEQPARPIFIMPAFRPSELADPVDPLFRPASAVRSVKPLAPPEPPAAVTPEPAKPEPPATKMPALPEPAEPKAAAAEPTPVAPAEEPSPAPAEPAAAGSELPVDEQTLWVVGGSAGGLVLILALIALARRPKSPPLVRVEVVGGALGGAGFDSLPIPPLVPGTALPFADEVAHAEAIAFADEVALAVEVEVEDAEERIDLVPAEDHEPEQFDIGPTVGEAREEAESAEARREAAMLRHIFEENAGLYEELRGDSDGAEGPQPAGAVEGEISWDDIPTRN